MAARTKSKQKPRAPSRAAPVRAQTVEPTPSRAKPRETFLGMPGSWKYPGLDAIVENIWNTDADARMFPPKVWGFGWSFNFGYATIKTKPVWARLCAFLLGLIAVLAILYAIVALSMLLWFAFDVFVLGNTGAETVVIETPILA